MHVEGLQLPLIHLNGTSKVNLLDDLNKAARKVHEAIGALIEMSPHGRDYYPLKPGAYERAREQHRTRVLALEKVYEELCSLAFDISKNVRPES